MKKIILLSICIILVLAVILTTTACDLTRKLKGAETTFPKLVKEATSFSFDLELTTESGDKILASCYKNNNDYAYNYHLDGKTYPTYRQIFIESKLYNILEVYENLDTPLGSVPLGSGTYYVEEKPYNSADNLLYTVTENILTASYVTLITKAIKEESADGTTLYKYDIDYEGVNYKVWFDSTYLRRIKITYSDGTFYDASFSNYKFGAIDTQYFKKPEETTGVYVQSPFTFEEWATMLNSFSQKINNCLPK